MKLDFNRVIQLKSVRIEKSRLAERELILSSPIKSDRSQISEMYRVFKDSPTIRKSSSKVECVEHRKKFLFIVLYLYAPSVLAGGKMPKGLRDDICHALNFHSMSTISDNCSDIVFLYQNYPDFRNDTNELFDYVISNI